MSQTFFDLLISHIFCGFPGYDDNIVCAANLRLQLLEALTQIALDPVSRHCIPYFLADREAHPEMLLILFLHIVNDKLPVGERIPLAENALEFLILFDSVFFLHHYHLYDRIYSI